MPNMQLIQLDCVKLKKVGRGMKLSAEPPKIKRVKMF
jgi:hypothetical protein